MICNLGSRIAQTDEPAIRSLVAGNSAGVRVAADVYLPYWHDNEEKSVLVIRSRGDPASPASSTTCSPGIRSCSPSSSPWWQAGIILAVAATLGGLRIDPASVLRDE